MNENNKQPRTPSADQHAYVPSNSMKVLQATGRHRAQRNAARGYPSKCSLRRSGQKRKPTRNRRHWLMAGEIGRARKVGDLQQIALRELVLARTIIPAKHFDTEPARSQSAFVPYRLKSVYQRTEEFATIFDAMFREYRERHWAIEARLAPRTQLHTWPDCDIVALWQARQHADLLGLPYLYYIRQAFEYCLTAGYKRCPAPNQIWQKPVRRAIEQASEHGAGRIARSEYRADVLHPMFLAENYRGHSVQVAALDDLGAKVKQYPDQFGLGSIMLQEKIMPELEARKRLGDARVDKVIAEYVPFNPRVQGEPLPADSKPIPGCFGLYRPASDVCRACTVATSCRTLDTEVRGTLIARHGTDAPRAAKDTSDATERKRRQRERDRLDRETGRKGGTEGGQKPR